MKQEDLEIVKQADQTIYLRLELLNTSFKTLDSLEGVLIDGSITIDANSDIRNQCELSLVVTDSSFSVNEGTRIWFDRYVRVKVGLLYLRTNEIIWYDRGLFLLNTAGYEYNQASNTLSLSMVDLMAKLTGDRGGYVSGSGTLIPAESNIRNAMISAVTQLGGFDKYIIEDVGEVVPYDMKFATGVCVMDIVRELRDLYPGWETFFDTDGTFRCQPIPTMENDPIVLDDHLLGPLVVNEAINIDFTEVKNSIEVWGADTVSEGQVTAIAKDNNADSPFDISKIGEIKEILSGSPYDKIYTNDLCAQRAQYELWTKTRLNDAIALETKPIYWLDVNQKLEYTPLNEEVSKQYIIKSINMPLGIGTMTINAIRFYPLYPEIVNG